MHGPAGRRGPIPQPTSVVIPACLGPIGSAVDAVAEVAGVVEFFGWSNSTAYPVTVGGVSIAATHRSSNQAFPPRSQTGVAFPANLIVLTASKKSPAVRFEPHARGNSMENSHGRYIPPPGDARAS